MSSHSETSTDQKETESNDTPDLQQLRRKRSAAKANITKKIKELTEWINSSRTAQEVQTKIKEFEDVSNGFLVAHSAYHSRITDEYDKIDSDEYFQGKTNRIENFNITLKEWLANLKGKLGSVVDETVLKPSDSASNVGVREQASMVNSRISKSSYRSKSSTAMGARLAVMARKAAIEAEKASFVKKQALEQETLKLEHLKHELQLDTRLAKAEAEERIYSEAMLTLPMSPTKIERDQENKSNIELQPKSRSLPEINLNPEAPEWATQPNRDKLNSNRQSEASSEVAQNFLRNMVDIQLQQQQQAQQMYQMQQVYNEQFQQILSHHQQMTINVIARCTSSNV